MAPESGPRVVPRRRSDWAVSVVECPLCRQDFGVKRQKMPRCQHPAHLANTVPVAQVARRGLLCWDSVCQADSGSGAGLDGRGSLNRTRIHRQAVGDLSKDYGGRTGQSAVQIVGPSGIYHLLEPGMKSPGFRVPRWTVRSPRNRAFLTGNPPATGRF
jgi:hypothetical protein